MLRFRKPILWIAVVLIFAAISGVKAQDSPLAVVPSTSTLTTPNLPPPSTSPSGEDLLSSIIPSSTTPSTSSPQVKTSSATPALGSLVVPSSLSTSTFNASDSTTTAPAPEEEKHISRFAKIASIRVDGNKNVRERVVLAEVKTRKGDLYDPSRLRKDVQAIYALGNFDDVTLDVTEIAAGVTVIFHVVEKPMIKKIDFKGNKKLSSGKLRDGISLKENDPLDKLKLNLDVDKILNLYKDEGFAAAQVEPYTTSDPTNHVTITFFVTEGKQVLITDVDLQGVTAYKTKKIIKLMKMRRKKVFKQDQLTKDLEEITKFYKNHGYQNIKIGDVKQTFDAEKTHITITVPIEEGPLFHFGKPSFSGNAIFGREKLIPGIQFKTGETFSQEKLDATISKLQDIYGAQGYIRVQIKPAFNQDLAKGIVDIDFQISEGEVVYVDHIGIEGNTHTKDYVIRREIKLKEGEPFNSVLARKSVERLYNLGFLDNVDVDVQQPNSPNKADVIFTVTEGKPGILSAGAGYSSVDGLIGTLQIQHINFLGRGQRLNLQAQIGGRLNSLDLGWTEPWLLGKPMSFGVDIFSVTRLLQLGTDKDAYDNRDRGFSMTLGPRFSDIYSLLFTYSYTDRLSYNINAADPAARAAILGPVLSLDPNASEISERLSNLTEQFVRDGRDNQFDPQRGTRMSAALTEGGLGPNTVQYYKPVLDASIHIPTFWKFVLSIHGQWAYVQTYGGSDETEIVGELFRVGGSDTVRGYDIGQVGASSIPGNAGGNIMTIYNVEYKFPIAPDEHGKTLLQGVFFYDIGGDWNSFNAVSYQVNSSPLGLKQGVGFGIRFKTPVFPLRLDFGIPLNRAEGDAHTQFYFNVGSLF